MYIFPSNYYQNSSKRLHFNNVYFLDRRALPYWKIGETQAFISFPFCLNWINIKKINEREREKESKKEKKKAVQRRKRGWERKKLKEKRYEEKKKKAKVRLLKFYFFSSSFWRIQRFEKSQVQPFWYGQLGIEKSQFLSPNICFTLFFKISKELNQQF